MSDFAFILIVFLISLTGIAVSIFFIKRETRQFKKDDAPLVGIIKQDIENLRKKFEDGYSKMAYELGKVQEVGHNIKEFQEFLRSPKLRGNIGEMVLKELLGQMLPKKTFNLQYSFKSGETVDAAIQTEAGLVPIDSKFPMENFRKMMGAETDKEGDSARKVFVNDVRKHIRAIAGKYILPDEGTIDYALMYIPSEAVYYEIVNDPDLFDYAGKNKVLPVSPTTFYAYMKAILASFEGQKVEERAKQILAALGAISKDYEKIADSLATLSRHLTNAHNQMNNVNASFNLLGQKLAGTRQLEEGTEISDNKALKGEKLTVKS